MKAAALVVGFVAAALASGCVRGSYTCTSDAQCDLGAFGRCELDDRCTFYDPFCPSDRRYAAHAEDATGTCFDDSRTPINACAEGQPPARREDCFADVCAALPACCDTGWSAACVQEAELRCPELRCDTRIAVTAVRAGVTELWDLRWDGAIWNAVQQPPGNYLAWVGPPPGGEAPRLARFAIGAGMELDGVPRSTTARTYFDAVTLDLRRDGRDTLVLASVMAGEHFLEVVDLGADTTVEAPAELAGRIVGGDFDHDAFPDLGAANTASRYQVLANVDDDAGGRQLRGTASSSVTGDSTPGGVQAIRGMAWADLDGNGDLDLVVSGHSLRIHLAKRVVSDLSATTLDCFPPQVSGGGCLTASASFVAAPLATPSGTLLAFATYPDPVIYTATVTTDGIATPTPVPGTACVGCASFIALVARDLDHDNVLDLIAIDNTLGVWATRSSPPTDLTRVYQIPTMLPAVGNIRTSVSGAPIP